MVSRISMAVIAGVLMVGCAAPVAPPAAPAPLIQSAPRVEQAQRPEDSAVATLRAALHRRGHAPEVTDGAMAALRFDPSRTITHQDGGRVEVIADGGAWLVESLAGRFWVYQNGLVLPIDAAS